jgi:hypothetical protein
MEIARQLSWSAARAELFYYRTKGKAEVDMVLEKRRGQAVAADAKASATVRLQDFAGLNHPASRLGDDLLVGLVLYVRRPEHYGVRLKEPRHADQRALGNGRAGLPVDQMTSRTRDRAGTMKGPGRSATAAVLVKRFTKTVRP